MKSLAQAASGGLLTGGTARVKDPGPAALRRRPGAHRSAWRLPRRALWATVVVCILVGGGSRVAFGISLDKKGEMKLGVRTYVNARIGTENTDGFRRFATDENGKILLDGEGFPVVAERSMTFPFSAAGHLRQNRAFVEVELKHRLDRLLKEGFGPLSLLHQLPFRVRGLSYGLTYRGEGDGIYDWGPTEYRSVWKPEDFHLSKGGNYPVNPIPADNGRDSSVCDTIPVDEKCRLQVQAFEERQKLRDRAVHRSRLFQAYVQATVGHFWVRFGRQIVAWGETDNFRLLDNINPVDNSFGGFLVPLDERRVPLDMLRAQYSIGSIGPIDESFVEVYGAIDEQVGYAPGTPEGSPWTLPNLGDPQVLNETFIVRPARTFRDMRGGGRIVWNMWDSTCSLAHYYTYFDRPRVQLFTNPADQGGNFPFFVRENGYSALVVETAPLVQVTGASTTLAIPSLYTVLRSEFAYFKGEPRYRQSEIDPFVFTRAPGKPTFGPRRTGDSVNFVLGFDINRFFRRLNPHQSFFISTQFFYKHLRHAVKRGPVQLPGKFNVLEGEVLPVPERWIRGAGKLLERFPATEPVYVRHPTDQFLHTLLISTSYRSSTINPQLLFFYDWGGAIVVQPSVTFARDPWRLTIDYSRIESSSLKGGSAVSLLRDRDNVQFRLEYVM
jgi:hypothetical protein